MTVSKQRIEKLSKALAKQQRVNTGLGVDSSVQLELMYRRQLLNFVSFLDKQALKVADGLKQIGYIRDQSPFVSLFPAFQIEKQVIDYEKTVFNSMETIFNKGQKAHRKAFVRNMDRAIGVDINSILTDFNIEAEMTVRIQKNADLIKSIPKEYFDKIESALRIGIDTGQTLFSIKEELQKIKGVTKSRAKLIAKDQTSKLFSDLNETRQVNIGIIEYIWRTVGDEGVRPTHEENDGKVFRWDSPPSTGHPGADVGCRCVADPVLTNLYALIGSSN